MKRKYEFTGEVLSVQIKREEKEEQTILLNKIRASIDIENHHVKVGDEGGWIQGEHNLSHQGTCWVMKDSFVFDEAEILEHALIVKSNVSEKSRVKGRAEVTDSTIRGQSKVTGNAEIECSTLNGKTTIRGDSKVVASTLKNVMVEHDVSATFSDCKIISASELFIYEDSAFISTTLSLKNGEIKAPAQFSYVQGNLQTLNLQAKTELSRVLFQKTSFITENSEYSNHVIPEKVIVKGSLEDNGAAQVITFREGVFYIQDTAIIGNVVLDGLEHDLNPIQISHSKLEDFSGLIRINSKASSSYKKKRVVISDCQLSGSAMLKLKKMTDESCQGVILHNDETVIF